MRRGLVMSSIGQIGNVTAYDAIDKPAFIFGHPDETSKHIHRHGIFERDLIEWSKRYLSPDTDFVDIGAHAGTYALSLAPHCRKVYAFEAQRMTYYQLCGGIALNQYDNVEAYNVALSDERDRFASLYVTSPDGGGSTLDASVVQHQGHRSVNEMPKVERCDVALLDDFKLERRLTGGRISLIKIDVEGWERQVIQGGLQTLELNGWPPILFEAWPNDWYAEQKQRLFGLLRDLGYNVSPAPVSANMFVATSDAK